MKPKYSSLVLFVAAVLLIDASAHADASRPNILLIMANDLGFSDLGCYGGEIATPNSDSVASDGLRFSQFDNTARCWPTRAALMSGFYAQQIRRDVLPSIPGGGQAGQVTRWARSQLLARLLPLSGIGRFPH